MEEGSRSQLRAEGKCLKEGTQGMEEKWGGDCRRTGDAGERVRGTAVETKRDDMRYETRGKPRTERP